MKIVKGVPAPVRKSSYAEVVRSMEVGDALSVKSQKEKTNVYAAINSQGFRAATQAQDDGTFLVWKLTRREDKTEEA